MSKKPDSENRYVLYSDGHMFDLLDPAVFDTDIDTTVTKLSNSGAEILQCANSPTKLFTEVVGLKKTGEFSKFGPTNWNNLFLIHGEYEYFMAYVVIDNVKHLTATSTTGVFWSFNIIDA